MKSETKATKSDLSTAMGGVYINCPVMPKESKKDVDNLANCAIIHTMNKEEMNMKTFELSCTYSNSFSFFDLIVKAESEEALRAEINSPLARMARGGRFVVIHKILSVKG